MGFKPPRPTLGQTLQLAQLISVVANINWKGFRPMWDKVKSFAGGINLKNYWGRLLLVTIAGLLIGFVLFDWRAQAVARVEAQAQLAIVTAERDTLALKQAGDAAASAERQRILMLMAEHNEKEMDDVQESIAANPDWAGQPVPSGLRNRLPTN